jgi:ribosomal subunit interface protein
MGFNLTDAIRNHVAARVHSAVGPFAPRVLKVTARLHDINAGRGGVDKRCSVVAAVRGRGTVVAESVQQDLYSAVDQAAGRMRSSIQRHLKRRLARARKDPQRPAAPLPV